ncbi:MAG: hypothetical protein HC849_03575 [Oscillatoriales cyanobacterium RU_3_3]|nr:hypothetical protein [Microcoleus sp. SU_5_6]NJL66319.1 hypothetical protein [Microcoleus sp. SM1_3_4]NJM59466.1 hypothetical protein [Oscillatoriales cyanobacterium RU_3_3]NJR23706.1 hypothetical protein [Richelia sp. CSU_2_1]
MNHIEGRRQKEEGRRKREEGRGKKADCKLSKAIFSWFCASTEPTTVVNHLKLN